ncbi:hypothetical protein PIROE2DRAFT_17153 [Piromyces sp. E2]|nr:hypothetical protein PIROE2DRAFT_17153 [Piromyces sp. E2]|eukprot:OUM57763.1 hypothetical protein PIROE2DRAFT_17153 [Piromyces sp. E2]
MPILSVENIPSKDILKSKRRVTFNNSITTITAHDNEVYDRTSIYVRPLKYNDIVELNMFIQEMQREYLRLHNSQEDILPPYTPIEYKWNAQTIFLGFFLGLEAEKFDKILSWIIRVYPQAILLIIRYIYPKYLDDLFFESFRGCKYF